MSVQTTQNKVKQIETTIGQYKVSVKHEQFYIYPKNKYDETMRINIERTSFHLKWKDETVTFKRFLHRGKWKWNDSRGKGACSEDHIITEVARMLFQRNESKAKDLLIAGLTGKQL